MKNWIAICSIALIVLGFPLAASAHVSVLPSESQTGAYETYTMKVPVEKESNTMKIVLKMPKGVTYVSYEPVVGFKTTFDESKKVITWEATGAGILPGQFMRFSFTASNPEVATKLDWDAFQYYADGSIVEWTGDINSDTPHAVTTVNTSSKEQADSHGNVTSKEQNEKNELSLWLIYTTLGISFLAIIVSLFALLRKKK